MPPIVSAKTDDQWSISGLWHSVRFCVISVGSNTPSLSRSCPRSMMWPPSMHAALSAEFGLSFASQLNDPPKPGVMTPPVPAPEKTIVGGEV